MTTMLIRETVLHEFAEALVIPPDALPAISWSPASYRERLSAQFRAFETVFDWESARWESVLDIGCGLAAFPAYLAFRYGVRSIHLIDGTGRACKVHGYVEAAQEPWGDVELGVRMVRANVSGSIEVTSHSPIVNAAVPAVDAVISLRSWGHHYPVAAYLPLVRRCLRPGGMLMLDLRCGVAGRAALADAGFVRTASVPDHSNKCRREVFRAP
jgi:SAM-dependent methyltransferase